MVTRPVSLLNAPYFAALVASSFKARASAIADVDARVTSGPASSIRGRSSSSNGASVPVTSSVRLAEAQSRRISASYDRASACNRWLKARQIRLTPAPPAGQVLEAIQRDIV